MSDQLVPRRIAVATVFTAVADGWAALRERPASAVAFAGVFAALGAVIFALLAHFGLSAMALPFAGGFLLVGPAVLAGFFGLRRAAGAGRLPGFADVLAGFRQAPRGLWVLAGVCSLLLLIWLTDAATVYSFMIGEGAPDAGQVARFHLWTSLRGAVLAFIVFNITAFAVPLLFDGRQRRKPRATPATSTPIATTHFNNTPTSIRASTPVEALTPPPNATTLNNQPPSTTATSTHGGRERPERTLHNEGQRHHRNRDQLPEDGAP